MGLRLWQKIFIGFVVVVGLAWLLIPRPSPFSSPNADVEKNESAKFQKDLLQENRGTASSVPSGSTSHSSSAVSAADESGSDSSSASPRRGASELFPQSYWIRQADQTALTPAQVRQLGLNPAAAVGDVSGFLVFAGDQFNSEERNFISGQPMIMKNQRTGAVGVVTGQLQVTLKDNQSLSSILRTYQLQVVDSFPHLRSYMVRSALSSVDLVKLKNNLAADSNVQALEIEILSRNYRREGF